MLSASPDLQAEIQSIVEAALIAEQPPAEEELKALKTKRDAITKRIKLIFEIAGDDSVNEAREQVSELRRQQREMNSRIEIAKQHDNKPKYDVGSLVESIIQRLTGLGRSVGTMPIYPLRQVLAAVTDSMTADMLTREVVMTLRVPEKALGDIEKSIEQLCLEQSSHSPMLPQAQRENEAILATIRCEFERQAQTQCFKCRRIKKSSMIDAKHQAGFTFLCEMDRRLSDWRCQRRRPC